MLCVLYIRRHAHSLPPGTSLNNLYKPKKIINLNLIYNYKSNPALPMQVCFFLLLV